MSFRPFLSQNFLIHRVGTKFYMEQDPNPDPNFFQEWDSVFFSNVGSGSGPKASGSATLVVYQSYLIT
jgi:hypothetical protein